MSAQIGLGHPVELPEPRNSSLVPGLEDGMILLFDGCCVSPLQVLEVSITDEGDGAYSSFRETYPCPCS